MSQLLCEPLTELEYNALGVLKMLLDSEDYETGTVPTHLFGGFATTFRSLHQCGVVEIDEGGYSLTSAGRELIRRSHDPRFRGFHLGGHFFRAQFHSVIETDRLTPM
jgi:hypothetical protein